MASSSSSSSSIIFSSQSTNRRQAFKNNAYWKDNSNSTNRFAGVIYAKLEDRVKTAFKTYLNDMTEKTKELEKLEAKETAYYSHFQDFFQKLMVELCPQQELVCHEAIRLRPEDKKVDFFIQESGEQLEKQKKMDNSDKRCRSWWTNCTMVLEIKKPNLTDSEDKDKLGQALAYGTDMLALNPLKPTATILIFDGFRAIQAVAMRMRGGKVGIEYAISTNILPLIVYTLDSLSGSLSWPSKIPDVLYNYMKCNYISELKTVPATLGAGVSAYVYELADRRFVKVVSIEDDYNQEKNVMIELQKCKEPIVSMHIVKFLESFDPYRALIMEPFGQTVSSLDFCLKFSDFIGPIEALKSIHTTYGYAHCDLGPQNWIWVNDKLVIIDWGFAKIIDEKGSLHQYSGTKQFAADEILNALNDDWSGEVAVKSSYDLESLLKTCVYACHPYVSLSKLHNKTDRKKTPKDYLSVWKDIWDEVPDIANALKYARLSKYDDLSSELSCFNVTVSYDSSKKIKT